MSGMSTKLHLIADKSGDYRGSSANISGEGFADMKFIARASTRTEFNDWVDRVKILSSTLDQTKYDKLAKPASQDKPSFYLVKDTGLYDRIVMKYMAPMNHEEDKKNEATDGEVPTEHGDSKMNHGAHKMEGM
jgi:cytochrome o ubiquinol oxidase subunit 2